VDLRLNKMNGGLSIKHMVDKYKYIVEKLAGMGTFFYIGHINSYIGIYIYGNTNGRDIFFF